MRTVPCLSLLAAVTMLATLAPTTAAEEDPLTCSELLLAPHLVPHLEARFGEAWAQAAEVRDWLIDVAVWTLQSANATFHEALDDPANVTAPEPPGSPPVPPNPGPIRASEEIAVTLEAAGYAILALPAYHDCLDEATGASGALHELARESGQVVQGLPGAHEIHEIVDDPIHATQCAVYRALASPPLSLIQEPPECKEE